MEKQLLYVIYGKQEIENLLAGLENDDNEKEDIVDVENNEVDSKFDDGLKLNETSNETSNEQSNEPLNEQSNEQSNESLNEQKEQVTVSN